MARPLVSPDGSFTGPRIRYVPPGPKPCRPPARIPVVLVIAVLLSSSALAALSLHGLADGGSRVSTYGVSSIPMTLVYQYKNSQMTCTAGPPCTGTSPDPPHEWDHAAGDDGVFNTADDCPHCSAYSAPASIAMFATALGRGGRFVQQDAIYDNGKSVPPEITDDNTIQTHGVGMFDGTGGQPREVQDAMAWAMGTQVTLTEHGASDPLTAGLLTTYIAGGRPVLWIDHGGWPVNQSSLYPPAANKGLQGHVKVIAGYDDRSTPGTGDDLCLIYDPWPEYDRNGILPANATLGPGGTRDPYWLPLKDVDLSDSMDIHIVTSVAIPEFSTVLVPVVGMLMAVAVARRARLRKDDA